MNVVFFVMGGLILIGSAVKSQVIYRSVVDSFPPQFQDDLNSRYAFHVLAFYSPTPLALQAQYLNSLWSACGGFLCIALGFFFSGNVPFGGLILLWLCVALFDTTASWKTYKENCKRAATQQPEEEP